MRKILILCLIGISGCATEQPISWNATGGSRADATVEVAYQYNAATVIPVTDQSQADGLARERCEAWGYSDAEPFGMETSRCQRYGSGIYENVCVDKWVTLEYQCLGRGDE